MLAFLSHLLLSAIAAVWATYLIMSFFVVVVVVVVVTKANDVNAFLFKNLPF